MHAQVVAADYRQRRQQKHAIDMKNILEPTLPMRWAAVTNSLTVNPPLPSLSYLAGSCGWRRTRVRLGQPKRWQAPANKYDHEQGKERLARLLRCGRHRRLCPWTCHKPNNTGGGAHLAGQAQGLKGILELLVRQFP